MLVLCINYVCIIATKFATLATIAADLIDELDDGMATAAALIAPIEAIVLKFEIGSNMNNINQVSITARVSLFLLNVGGSVSI